jgi:hypothetical protein
MAGSNGLLGRIKFTLSRDDPASDKVEIRKKEAFSGWPMVIGWLAMLIFAFHACTHMVAAGDTWVAMACGRHFVNHGVDTVEPFSANSHKAGPTAEEVKTWPTWAQWITNTVGLDTVAKWHPTGWIDQNWLTHVLFYKLTTMFGSEDKPYFDALVYWKLAVYILVVACLYFTSRVLGINRALAVVFACAAMFIGRSFLDVRPAGFSNLMVPAFLLVLALTSYRNALYIWLIVPLIVFWSNVHGGYIYAFLMLVPFVGWHVMMRLPKRWAIAIYSIGMWAVMCVLANKLTTHEYYRTGPISIHHDWVLYVLLVAIAGSVALVWNQKLSEKALVGLHIAISFLLFLLYLTRFLPPVPTQQIPSESPVFKLLTEDIARARIAHAGIFLFAMVMGVTVASMRARIVHVMQPKSILHTVAAGVVAFIAMVIFNPFHLTNLTHTFEISVSEHAARWRDVNEWHRAFDWTNPVGTAIPFLTMYVAAWLFLALWMLALTGAARITSRQPEGRKKAPKVEPTWPRLDIALLIIAAMTVYMAIKSRRFIPIAAYAACPIVALLIDHVVRVTAAAINLKRTDQWQVPQMPAIVRLTVPLTGAIVVLVLGTYWGLKFKRVYLEYWPNDPTFTSVFMRMTASEAKPFTACQFIRANKLSGNMFNYWTEGGFIAWGQVPDPNTGKTPLQLFMDGRAQAAYDCSIFDQWTQIMSGGPTVIQAAREGRDSLKLDDYVQIGRWLSDELRKHNVWTVLMPADQFDKPFVYGLECGRDWRTVFTDNKQKLFVDVNSPQGRKLFENTMAGKVIYPDAFSANMTLGYNLLLASDPRRRKQGVELITKTLLTKPSPSPMLDLLMSAGRYPELRPQIDQVCMDFAMEFEQNRTKYAGHDGYLLRLEATRLCLVRLEQAEREQGNARAAQAYMDQIERYTAERNRLSDLKRW